MKKRNKNSKSFLLLASLALIVTAVIGTTMAYLVSDTPTVTNTFTPAKVDSEVVETLETNVKKDVQIQNTGDIEAYIRAKVVVTWQKTEIDPVSKKEVVYVLPAENGDYNITLSNVNWREGQDGFYYWSSPVNPHVDAEHPENDGCYTGILIESCSPVVGKAPAGYNLHVEILAEAIQAEPIDAVKDAWKIDPITWKSIN